MTQQTDTKRKNLLKKVQALLAKADSTEFGPERDAFREKADNLMLEYAIDQAELAEVKTGRSLKDQVIRRRIQIVGGGSPYREALADLLSTIVRHARCELVYHGYGSPVKYPLYGSIIGMEADVDYVEMLFTSLKLQLANELEPSYDDNLSLEDNVYAMRNAGLKWNRIEHKCGIGPWGPAQRAYERACEERGEEPRKNVNPRTVKRSFVEGFASKIANRLWEIKKRQREQHGDTSQALVPVTNAVKEAKDDMFSNLKPIRPSQGGKHDGAAWQRGKKAGARADLNQPRAGNVRKGLQGG